MASWLDEGCEGQHNVWWWLLNRQSKVVTFQIKTQIADSSSETRRSQVLKPEFQHSGHVGGSGCTLPRQCDFQTTFAHLLSLPLLFQSWSQSSVAISHVPAIGFLCNYIFIKSRERKARVMCFKKNRRKICKTVFLSFDHNPAFPPIYISSRTY